MKPLYTSVTMKKIIDRFLGQIFSDDSEKKAWQVYTNAFHREKLCKHCIQVWRWKYNALYKEGYETTVYKCDNEKIIDGFLGQIFSDEAPKKAWHVYTNALHREKLCKHCIQVWRWKKKLITLKKTVWQVYTMHYIGKSYETTVYECDDEKNLITVKKKCDKCIQCII